jgi:hypothetical protein
VQLVITQALVAVADLLQMASKAKADLGLLQPLQAHQ